MHRLINHINTYSHMRRTFDMLVVFGLANIPVVWYEHFKTAFTWTYTVVICFTALITLAVQWNKFYQLYGRYRIVHVFHVVFVSAIPPFFKRKIKDKLKEKSGGHV